MKRKIFIVLGYQNFTDYFIELSKLLKNDYEITCLVYGYKNYLKVKENKKIFNEIYCYEKLVNLFYSNKKNIDFNKLISVEKNLESLWKLLYTDRQLLDYFFDVDYGDDKLNYNELLNFAIHWIDFFEKIFSSNEYKYLISYSTASFPGVLSVKIAEKYNVENLCFKTIGIPDRFSILDDLNDKFLVPEKNIQNNQWSQNFYNRFNDNNKPNWVKQTKRKSFLKKIFLLINNNIYEKKVFEFIDNNRAAYLNHTLFKIFKLKIKKTLRKLKYHFIKKETFNSISFKYIFFPLHVEPESNLMVKNILSTDQLSVLENISKLCPINLKIIVKDHPNQPIRNADYYNRIKKIPNVVLVDSSINSRKLIRNSEAVFCISGTSVVETILIGKKLLVFGNNIIVNNFFPELKCNYSDFREKISSNYLPDKQKVLNMLSYLKDISTDLDSSILFENVDAKKVAQRFFELFKRVDEYK